MTAPSRSWMTSPWATLIADLPPSALRAALVRVQPVAVRPEPPGRRVWIDVGHHALAVQLLHSPPEARLEQLAVRVEKLLAQVSPESQEGAELLRKDVVRSHKIPRFRRHFFFLGGGLRQLPEAAIVQKTKLVIVVEDEAAVS